MLRRQFTRGLALWRPGLDKVFAKLRILERDLPLPPTLPRRMDSMTTPRMLIRIVAPLLFGAIVAACDDVEVGVAQRASPFSSADATSPSDPEDTSIQTASEVAAPEPSPNNIEGREELRAAFERLIAESPEFRAAVQNTRPFDPNTPMRVLEPVPPPPAPTYCGTDSTYAHSSETPPAPSARPGARDIVPHRYHSEVEPARRGLHRPEADRANRKTSRPSSAPTSAGTPRAPVTTTPSRTPPDLSSSPPRGVSHQSRPRRLVVG